MRERYGNPCKTRFLIKKQKHNGKWRIFELVQPGQDLSDYGDCSFRDFEAAVARVRLWIAVSRELCEAKNATT